MGPFEGRRVGGTDSRFVSSSARERGFLTGPFRGGGSNGRRSNQRKTLVMNRIEMMYLVGGRFWDSIVLL